MVQAIYPFRTLPFLEKLAVFTERRQEVLSGNIANVSTPGYRTRDLPVADFQAALKQSLARNDESSAAVIDSFSTGSPLAPEAADLFPAELFQASERPNRDLTFQDAGNRNVEKEVMEMTKNSIMQNFAIELMSAQLNLMQAVITEKP